MIERVPCGVGVILPHQLLPGYYMLKRQGSHGEGKWASPGGWVDPGEDPIDTAVRECQEELGIDVHVLTLVGYTHDVFPEGVEDICLWFHADEWSGTPEIMEPHKASDLRLFTLDDLAALPEDELFTPFEKFEALLP